MEIISSTSEVLKVDTVGRVRTPREKQEEVVAAYEGSGMTGQQFAAYCGVKYSTLMNWVGKTRRARRALTGDARPRAMSWVEASLEEPGPVHGEGLSVEIAGGVRLLVSSSRQAELAAEVIRCLGVVKVC